MNGRKTVTSSHVPRRRSRLSPTPQFEGHFDMIEGLCALGWAIDLAQPANEVRIEIVEGETVVAQGSAATKRPDVMEAGHPREDCGFQIELPNVLADGREHTLVARPVGSPNPLKGSFLFTLNRNVVTAEITHLENAALVGWITVSQPGTTYLILLADGEQCRAFEVATEHEQQCNRFEVPLPVRLLDGRPHWFCIIKGDSSALVAQMAFITPYVLTPEIALQRYTQTFPALLSAASSLRFESLQAQLANAPKWLRAQSVTAQAVITEAEWFAQLHAAITQLQRGFVPPVRNPVRLRFPVFDTPVVTVVIPVHNNFSVTYNCLCSLLVASTCSSYEVVVVDDGSDDLTSTLSECAEGVRVLRNKTSCGFVSSSNLGAGVARGEYVVILNNDTEVTAFWLDEMVHVFNHFDSVGLVGGKLLYPDGKLQEAGGVVYRNCDVANFGRDQNAHAPEYNYTREVHYSSGACIMLRKSHWDELEGFDAKFSPAYYEDTDLAFRVRSKGLKVLYTPLAKVFHFEGVSNGLSLESGVKRYQRVNESKFRERWGTEIIRFGASEHSKSGADYGVQLRALVIDAECPQPDKDAGGYAAVQEMRLLQALGFKVTFIPANLAYLGNYTEALQRQGVECLFAPFSSSIADVLEKRGKEFDLVYITRYGVAEKVVSIVRSTAPQAKILFNDADLHFLREIRSALITKCPESMQVALRTREAELSVMRQVDATLSYTDIEAAVIVSHNLGSTRVLRCPWVVEERDHIPGYAARKGIAFLGSFRHPPNAEAVQFFVAHVMPLLRSRLPGITLHIYGSHASDNLAMLSTLDVVVEGWVHSVEQIYDRCRVFVAPLQSGAGIKGKVIGALARGVPSVLSSIAAEGIRATEGSEFTIAESPAEWVEAIAGLYENKARWTRMSLRARKLATAEYSFGRGVETMRKALAAVGIYGTMQPKL